MDPFAATADVAIAKLNHSRRIRLPFFAPASSLPLLFPFASALSSPRYRSVF